MVYHPPDKVMGPSLRLIPGTYFDAFTAGNALRIRKPVFHTGIAVEFPPFISIDHFLFTLVDRSRRTLIGTLHTLFTKILQTEVYRLIRFQRQVRGHDGSLVSQAEERIENDICPAEFTDSSQQQLRWNDYLVSPDRVEFCRIA